VGEGADVCRPAVGGLQGLFISGILLSRIGVDRDGNQLTPFVANTIPRVYGQYETKAGPRDPEAYLSKWKVQNGMD
jgi:hypothetical protein